MFTAADAIARLDAALTKAGSDIVLRRVVGAAPGLTNKDVTVRAAVRSGAVNVVVDGVAQIRSKVIISPTQISAAGWPVGEVPSATVADPHLPRRNDKTLIAGRIRNVEAVEPFYMAGTLVRLELEVDG